MDLPLLANLDRANNFSINPIQKFLLKENTFCWFRGGLSPMRISSPKNGYIDAYGRNIDVRGNTVYIEGKLVYESSGMTVGKPVKGKYYYSPEADDFVPNTKNMTIHGSANGYDCDLFTKKLLLDGVEIGDYDEWADYFYKPGTLYVIMQGKNVNYQYNGTAKVSNNIDYMTISGGNLCWTVFLQDIVGTLNHWNEYDYETEQTTTINSPANSRCYSRAKGPGYHLAYYNTGNANTYYCYINKNNWAVTGLLAVDGNTGLTQPQMAFDVSSTQKNLDSGSVGSTDSRQYVSNVAPLFSYRTDYHLIVTNGAQNIYETNAGQATAPQGVFDSMMNNKLNTRHWYKNELGYEYRVEIGEDELQAQKMAEYVWLFNDGASITSSEDSTTLYPPIKLNLGFFTPYMGQGVSLPGPTNAMDSLFLGASNNGNYELTDQRTTGGVATFLRINSYGNPILDNLSNNTPDDGYYYIGSTATGSQSIYTYSIVNGLRVQKQYLAGTFYVNVGQNPEFVIPPNVSVVRSRMPAVLFSWADAITSVGSVSQNRTMLNYYLLDTLYGSSAVFYFLRAFFVFDGENIYQSAGTPGQVAWQGSIISIAEGLRFLGSDSSRALFWSANDGWIYVFTGDYHVTPAINLSNTSIKDSVYLPSMDTYFLLTDDEILCLSRDSLIYNIPGKYDSIESSLKGLIVRKDNFSYIINFSEGNALPQKWQTTFLTGKESTVNKYNELYVRLQKISGECDIKITAESLLTLDNPVVRTFKQHIDFKDGKGFSVVKTALGSTGRALSVTVEITKGEAQIQGISADIDSISKTPVKGTGYGNN